MFAARTYARNLDWRDEPSLWASAVEAAPNSYMTHLGVASSAMGAVPLKPETIDREVSRSLAILNPLPDDRGIPLPYATAGYWYRTRGEMTAGVSANPWYQEALAVLQRGKRIDLALSAETRRRNRLHGKTLLYYSPGPGLYLDLGRVYLRLLEPRQALEPLEYGRLLSPEPSFSEELANAYLAAGDDEGAAVSLHEGLILNPDHRPFVSELATLYRKLDLNGCAVVKVGKREALNRNCPVLRNNECNAARNVMDLYFKTGRRDEADQLRHTATGAWSCPASLFQ